MRRGFNARCFGRLWVLVLLAILSSLNAHAMQIAAPAAKAIARHAAKPAVPPPIAGAPRPQLLNFDTDPTLRYPVSVSEGSISCGWLDIRDGGMLYTVVVSGAKSKASFGAVRKFAPGGPEYLLAPPAIAASEGFEIRSGQLSSIRLEKEGLRLAFPRRAPLVIYLPQDQWGAAQKPHEFEQMAHTYSAGTAGIQRSIQNFGAVLVELTPPPIQVNLRAESPTVEKGHQVSLVWSSSNATSLDLEPGVGNVALTGGVMVSPKDSTDYILTARSPAGSKVSSVFVTVTQPAAVVPPTLILLEPAGAADGQTVTVSSSPLVISGVVMDSTGIPVVTVNGRPVTIRPTNAEAAQFRSDPLDLQSGDNQFEIAAVNSARGQSKVSFVARFAPAAPKAQPAPPSNPRGLGKDEIISLLQGAVPNARVAALVRERGIKFVPSADDLKEIQAQGGDAELMDAINLATRQ